MGTFIMYVILLTLGLSSCVFAAWHLVEFLSKKGFIEQEPVEPGAVGGNEPAKSSQGSRNHDNRGQCSVVQS